MPSPVARRWLTEGGLWRHIGLRSATAIVVANIIGSGIFTTTGFQAAALGHPGWIFALWILGGLLAFCGALCYGELGAAMPEAGGEYVYLRETYGPLFGFMSAFVSLIAGFSAPIAAAAKGFAYYLKHFAPGLSDSPQLLGLPGVDWVALAVVWALVLVHLSGARGGVVFNDLATLFKVGGIVAILVGAVVAGRGRLANLAHVAPSHAELERVDLLAAFGTSLIFVMFCYSGWNASAYVAAEMKSPQRDLPRSLLLGTGVVLALYLSLNAVYFYGADVEALAGQPEVGLIASRALFGRAGVSLVTAVILVSLLASASAMTIAGPRVYYAMGRDCPPLGFLATAGAATGAPAAALLLQGVVTSALVVSGRLDQIQQYTGFTLTLFGSLAVLSVIVLRFRRPELPRPFRAWGYPATPLVFLGVASWMMFWAYRGRPVESRLALLTVAAGGAAFYASRWIWSGRART